MRDKKRNVKTNIGKFQLEFTDKKYQNGKKQKTISIWESVNKNLEVRIFSYAMWENWSRKEDFTKVDSN